MRVIRICRPGYTVPPPPRQIIRTLLVVAALFAASARAADPPEITILAAGIFAPAPAAEDIPPGLRDQTLSGVDRIPLPSLEIATETIPARLCRSFGLIFTRAGRAETPLTVRISHPPLHRPDGRIGSVDLFDIPPGAGRHFVGFTFTEPWEMVAGEWVFTLLAGDHLLARESFTVVASDEPAERAPPPGGCGTTISRAGGFRFAAWLGMFSP